MSAAAGSEGRWTLAFAIVMLLLFSFFLVLYATSKREVLRLEDEITELRSARSKPSPETLDTPAASDEKREALLGANADLQEQILFQAKAFLSPGADANASRSSDVEVLDLANGDFLVRIASPNLFQAGKSRVSNEMRPFVNRLGELILKSGRRLRIEGHADFGDSEAIQRKASEFANTWELSAARAAGMAQYWMRKFDFNPEKIEVTAYGKYRPLEKKAGRSSQANRRIEVVILRSE